MSHGFLRNTTIVGLLTLLSRITGVIRDMVYAISFGAGPLMDAFLVAFKIPNFMRRLFAEGAFSQAFVPVISEYKVRKQPRGSARAGRRASPARSGVILFVITLIGVIAAPVLAYIFAPGFHSKRRHTSTSRSRCCAGRSRTCSSSRSRALGRGVLNSYDRFARAGVHTRRCSTS